MDITTLLADLVKFVQLSQASYDALVTKDDKSLYFVTNGTSTKLYKGDTLVYNSPTTYDKTTLDAGLAGATVLPFNEVFILQDTNSLALAKSAADGKSYTVLMGMSTSVEDTDSYAPTGKAVRTYVTTEVQALRDEMTSGTVTAVSYDKAAKAISVTAGGTTTTTALENLATGISYANGVLSLSDVAGTVLSTVNMELERFLKDAYYDEATTSLVFEIQVEGSAEATKITIPAADFVTLYEGKATTTAETTVTAVEGGSSTIEVAVKLSNNADNAITEEADGLHVDITGKVDKVNIAADNIVLAAGSGAVKDSGVTIDAAFDASGATKIPTSQQTATWVTTNAVMESQKATTIRVDGTAVDTTVATEKAVADAINTNVQDALMQALSWKVVQ